MNNLSMRKFILFMFILSLAVCSCNTHLFKKNASRRAERGLFGKSRGKRKEVKVKESRTVNKAKKKQEAKDQKLKKDYKQSVKQSQKRTIDIQTPEVQARMKQNQKDSAIRDKVKKKKTKSSTKKAGEKYK
jgi:preprotein translocase subunit SecF